MYSDFKCYNFHVIGPINCVKMTQIARIKTEIHVKVTFR